MICAACHLARDPDDLLAFWPVGRPAERRFVCRVTHPSPAAQESCFRAVVASRRIHEIGPAIAADRYRLEVSNGFWAREATPA